jgi:hypothetical protein
VSTCVRRHPGVHEWTEAGVFDQLHQFVLNDLGRHSQPDWSLAALDSVSVRAKRGVL